MLLLSGVFAEMRVEQMNGKRHDCIRTKRVVTAIRTRQRRGKDDDDDYESDKVKRTKEVTVDKRVNNRTNNIVKVKIPASEPPHRSDW